MTSIARPSATLTVGAERLFDDDVRQRRELRGRPRHRRAGAAAPAAGCRSGACPRQSRATSMAQHMVVMRGTAPRGVVVSVISLREGPRRCGGKTHRAGVRAIRGNSRSNCGAPAMRIIVGAIAVPVRPLAAHQIVPDQQAVDPSNGSSLFVKLSQLGSTPSRARRADRRPQQRHLGKDQPRARASRAATARIDRTRRSAQGCETCRSDQVVARLRPDHRRRGEATPGAPWRRSSESSLGARLGAADLHRLGDAGIDIARLHQRQKPRLETGRPMRRQILERDARMLELAHERRRRWTAATTTTTRSDA